MVISHFVKNPNNPEKLRNQNLSFQKIHKIILKKIHPKNIQESIKNINISEKYKKK